MEEGRQIDQEVRGEFERARHMMSGYAANGLVQYAHGSFRLATPARER
jgi:hypothetical protein